LDFIAGPVLEIFEECD